MSNYQIKTATIDLTKASFLNSIPTELLKEQDLFLIPTKAYTVLLELIREDRSKDNYEFVNSYIKIIKELINRDGQELPRIILKNYNREYNSIINQLHIDNFIVKIKKPFFNKLNPEESNCAVYTLNEFTELTFISLIDLNVESKLKLEVEGLLSTPLNNENFINTLLETRILTNEAVYAEYQYCVENDKDYKKFLSRVNNILSFTRSRSAAKGENVNRVYSSFTSLSRVSRKFLVYDGNPFYEVDIKNCQPLLLICILSEMGYHIDQTYIDDVTTGNFYEALMAQAIKMRLVKQVKIDSKSMNTKYLTNRDDVKILVYSDILFCTKLKDTAIVKIFKSLYPRVYKALKEITEQLSLTDEKLARPLQNMEAEIVLSVIPKSNYFTVHDAIYITDKREINHIKNMLIRKINKKSNGLIKNILFGKIESYDIIKIDDNEIEVITKVLRSKDKFKTRKKFNNLMEFKSLYGTLTIKEIQEKLGLSRSSIMKYKKQLKLK